LDRRPFTCRAFGGRGCSRVHSDDQPSIGIILCKSKNSIVAEYALRDLRKPVGVSEYRFTAALPKKLKGSLPTIDELEKTLKDKPAQ